MFTTSGMKMTHAQKETVPTVLYCQIERDRRWAVTSVSKFSFYCTTMILCCLFMYIPVYYRANEQLSKGVVTGWPIHSNRNTKIYVQPDHVTAVHEPKDVCPKSNRDKKNSLFLLIVVCSSTINFDRRVAIRETWGSYQNYVKSGKIFKAVQEKYKNYNYTYDLYEGKEDNLNISLNLFTPKWEMSVFGRFLPELAKAKIPPPQGLEDSPDFNRVLSLLKKFEELPKNDIVVEDSENTEVDFKLVFLLGLSCHANYSEIQDKIEDEVDKYGDIIQEDFIDSYNNLTLKSIMMLKWVTNNCKENVRYILKTDDDMYVNVPSLVQNLRIWSKVHDNNKRQRKEYLLIGDLIYGARPIQDSDNKWYSPRYMYGGLVYPRYLSGTGYALSAPAARALYHAALRTTYFHLEDIYITGMCSVRAYPRIVPRHKPGFLYDQRLLDACVAFEALTTHHVSPALMRCVAALLLQHTYVARCERIRLTQIRKERLKSRQQKKKLSKLSQPLTSLVSSSGQVAKLGQTWQIR